MSETSEPIINAASVPAAALEFHPAANLFPMMDEDSAEFKALVDDIKKHGLHEDITLYGGEILDGRNRYRACLAARIKPTFYEYKVSEKLAVLLDGQLIDSPLEWVISKNLHRRHLTDDQRAVIAAEMIPMLEAEAKERMSEGGQGGVKSPDLRGRSDQKAADTMKVSQHKVRAAKKVAKADPELAKNVKSGKTPLRKAKAAITEKKAIAPKKPKTSGSKWVNKVEALIDAGETDPRKIAQKASVAESYVRDELAKRAAKQTPPRVMSPQLATAMRDKAGFCIADPEACGLQVTEDGSGYVPAKEEDGAANIKAGLTRLYADQVEKGELKEGPRGYKQAVAEELAKRKILRVGLGHIPPVAHGLHCGEQMLACFREERDVLDDLIYIHNRRDWDVPGMPKLIEAYKVVLAQIDSWIAANEKDPGEDEAA